MRGQQYRSRITGNVYDIKRVVNQRVMLETPNGMSKVLTELEILKLFYEKLPKKADSMDESAATPHRFPQVGRGDQP